MPNVTFSSPQLKKDVTVYAVAGDTKTLLAVAKANKIPLSFECENGECGSCPVEVSVLSTKRKIGTALTEKEKTVLKLAGKITAAAKLPAVAEPESLAPDRSPASVSDEVFPETVFLRWCILTWLVYS